MIGRPPNSPLFPNTPLSRSLLDDEVIPASAKTGLGVADILEALVTKLPPPVGDPTLPLRAMIFDSHYDPYKGVIAYLKVVEGDRKSTRLNSSHANISYAVFC